MDVVTFGETMVLFVPDRPAALRYVHQFTKTIGGAESNVAIGLSRLGHQVGWFGRLGQDEFGKYIRNFIRGEGVDTSRVVFDAVNPTAVFFKERKLQGDPNVIYYRKGSAASRICASDLDFSYIEAAKYLHITGITPALSPDAKECVRTAMAFAKSKNVKIVFDPNLRRKLWGEDEARSTLLELAAQADIVLPGLDEAAFMTGQKKPEKSAEELLKRGCKIVVIKLGEGGAYYCSDHESGTVNGYPVRQIVDTVGAGDAFAAGFLSGQIRGLSLFESVQLGNRMGAYALTVEGDVEGVPDKDRMEMDSYAR